MQEPSLVSAIIPVYNCEHYLAAAIASVLAQTYRPLEIVVVDDGSTDGSADVARRFVSRDHYCYQPHGGIGAARNRGAELATGSFLAFLDADDLWVEDKLTRQMAAFDADPELDVVFGYVEQFVSPELDDRSKEGLSCPSQPAPGYSPGATLAKTESFRRVGPFETAWVVGEFIDWYLRAIDLGLKSLLLPDVVLKRRLHTTNQGIREREFQTDYVRILKASLDRRRR